MQTLTLKWVQIWVCMHTMKLHNSDDYILHARVTFGHACDMNINGTCNTHKENL